MPRVVSKTLTIILLTVFMVQLEGCFAPVLPCVTSLDVAGARRPPIRGLCNTCWDNVFNENGNYDGAASQQQCGANPMRPCKDPVFTNLCNTCRNTPDVVGNISCN